PEPGVARYEAVGVHLQLGGEASVVALVRVDGLARAPIDLLEKLEGEPGEAQPGRANRGGLPRREPETADWQGGRGRGEAEVDIEASGHGGARHVVEPPAPLCVASDLDANRAVAPPSRHRSAQRLPGVVADHAIVQTAGLSRLREQGGAREVPLSVVEDEAGARGACPSENAPHGGGGGRWSSADGAVGSCG